MTSSVYDFDVPANDGQIKKLQEYAGKVLLIVNTASKCGFTPQYEGLETLYKDFQQQGLEILAFPCDQFGHQEPGDDGEIASFCSLKFNVSFPLFAKTQVNGDDASPLYQHLKQQAPGLFGTQSIKWNFTKFLVDTQGKVVKRYSPKTKPEAIQQDIQALLPVSEQS